MKPLFAHNPSLNTRLLLALIASIVLFFIDTRMNYFVPIRSVLSTVVYPIQTMAALPKDISDWVANYFQSQRQLKEKNTELEATNLLNSVRLQRLKALERENIRLRKLLGSSFRLRERVLVAELLTIDLDPSYQQVVIDKGQRYDVFVGQPVLDATGVMGQVTEVNPFSSRVVLLTDPSHAIPVQVNRNGLRSIATGWGLGESLQLENLPHNADVRIGDSLVTSGLGGRFPVGYPVGTVVSVNFPQGKAFAEIGVKPAAQLSTSREVLLVLPAKMVEISKKSPDTDTETETEAEAER
ncbi:MAG: rod shape-determining protein MreC [Gammaproteobacteria bacterium]|nr:MAG: rod shape-determining protein MreC [Gammaproteobacteria bacterium]